MGTRLHSGPFQTTLNSGPTHFCKHLRGRWCGRSIGLVAVYLLFHRLVSSISCIVYIYCSTVLYQPPPIYLISATSHNRVYRPCSSARSTSSRAGPSLWINIQEAPSHTFLVYLSQSWFAILPLLSFLRPSNFDFKHPERINLGTIVFRLKPTGRVFTC